MGTQNDADTVAKALEGTGMTKAGFGDGPSSTANSQTGLVLQTDEPTPEFLGLFSVCGDELQQGPTFNYARVFTWWHVATTLHGCFKEAANKYNDEQPLTGPTESRPEAAEAAGNAPVVAGAGNTPAAADAAARDAPTRLNHDESFRIRDLNGTVESIRDYCGLRNRRILAYPSEIDAKLRKRIVVAFTVGAFVQWGMISPAILIAYQTDVKGLGCRSGSYLLYGVVGTVSFFLLFASVLFSHVAMVAHQQRTADMENPEQTPSMSGSEGALRFFAVATRLFGRALAIVNTIWIILSSLWELVGFYDSCWCEGTVLSKGGAAWVVLFRTAEELRERAEGPWAGGIAMSCVVAFLSWGLFTLLCRDSKR